LPARRVVSEIEPIRNVARFLCHTSLDDTPSSPRVHTPAAAFASRGFVHHCSRQALPRSALKTRKSVLGEPVRRQSGFGVVSKSRAAAIRARRRHSVDDVGEPVWSSAGVEGPTMSAGAKLGHRAPLERSSAAE
jgi:hypothetical protein